MVETLLCALLLWEHTKWSGIFISFVMTDSWFLRYFSVYNTLCFTSQSYCIDRNGVFHLNCRIEKSYLRSKSPLMKWFFSQNPLSITNLLFFFFIFIFLIEHDFNQRLKRLNALKLRNSTAHLLQRWPEFQRWFCLVGCVFVCPPQSTTRKITKLYGCIWILNFHF